MGGPQRDLHSGNDGGVFNEPLADLTKVLASLIDSRNNVQVRRPSIPFLTPYDVCRQICAAMLAVHTLSNGTGEMPLQEPRAGVVEFLCRS